MSYILDALKKAESERERGQVPGLNAAPLDHGSRIAYGEGFAPWLRWLVALGVLLAMAYGAWRYLPATSALDTSPATAAAPVASPAPAAAAPVPVPVPAGQLTPAASAVAHVRAPVAALPAEPAIFTEAPAAVPTTVVPKPATLPPRTAAGAVPLLQDLPDSLRRQIPALNISGSIYSDSPAEWTLIVNDQVLAKGGQVAPELRLEEIGPSSAVFNFRGQRFRMER